MENLGKRGEHSQINPPVFFGAAAIIFAVVIFGATVPDLASDVFAAVQAWVIDKFGWFYLLSVAVFLIFCIILAASRYGDIKLGPDDTEPDYSYTSWFAMLFSAGMGIGLMFYRRRRAGCMHFTNPPVGDGGTRGRGAGGDAITFFHWGLHAWAIYAVVGLSLAYFAFRHNLPLTIRSALYPADRRAHPRPDRPCRGYLRGARHHVRRGHLAGPRRHAGQRRASTTCSACPQHDGSDRPDRRHHRSWPPPRWSPAWMPASGA